MTEAEVNNELMFLSNFYGTLAATQGIDEDIKKKCNFQIKRLLLQLDKGTDHLISTASGILLS